MKGTAGGKQCTALKTPLQPSTLWFQWGGLHGWSRKGICGPVAMSCTAGLVTALRASRHELHWTFSTFNSTHVCDC